MSALPTPNHRARVAEYSSTEVVGIHRPWPESSGPLLAEARLKAGLPVKVAEEFAAADWEVLRTGERSA